MDFSDLKNKSEKELRELLAEQRQHLHVLRFKVGEKQLKNVKTIQAAKTTIARILTLLRKKESDKEVGETRIIQSN